MAEGFIYDGDDNFLGGQDASKRPDNVFKNSYYAGINVTTEQGSLSPRWGYQRLKLDWRLTGNLRLPNFKARSYQEIFESGKFQAFIPYSIDRTYYLIVIISGIIFLVNQRTWQVSVLPIEGGPQLNENTNRIAWSEATKFLILYDYPNFPVIIEGVSARRSNPLLHEIPVSTLGGYNQNRLFIVNAGNELTAGDPIGLRGIDFANPPISFLEIETLGGDFFGQAFQLSTNYNNDRVTALTFLQVVDTSTGIGPLLIATRKAVWSYQSQSPRASWEANQFGSIFLNNTGIIGFRSHVGVSSDLFFMSADGEVRAISMSRGEQSKWSKVPLSREIKNWLKFWDVELKEYSVLGYFRNKVFVSVNPYHTTGSSIIGKVVPDYAHGGLAVFELDNVSNLKGDSPPVWAGLWTGVRPMDMTNNDERFFIMSKDDDKRNRLYEMTPDRTYDVLDGRIRYVRSRIYTRDYDFEQPMIDKSLVGLEFNIEDLQGPMNINIKYMPSHHTVWAQWRTNWKHNAPWQTFEQPEPHEIDGFGGHSFKRLNFGEPEDTTAFSPVTEDSYDKVRRLRLAIDITGKYWELNQIILRAVIGMQDENEAVADGQFKEVSVPVDLEDDWKIVDDLCERVDHE